VLEGETARVPLVARAPLQPPDPVQAVALAEDHVNVELAPEAMLAGLAERVAVGGGVVVTAATETVTLAGDDTPCIPIQVKL